MGYIPEELPILSYRPLRVHSVTLLDKGIQSMSKLEITEPIEHIIERN